MKKGYTYNQVAGVLLFISLMMLFLASSINYERQIERLQEDIEKQEQYYECFIDSLYQQIDYMKQTFDSIPIGSPMDTLVIRDKYGIRKHPVFGV